MPEHDVPVKMVFVNVRAAVALTDSSSSTSSESIIINIYQHQPTIPHLLLLQGNKDKTG